MGCERTFKTMHYLVSTYYMLVLAYKRGSHSPLQVASFLGNNELKFYFFFREY